MNDEEILEYKQVYLGMLTKAIAESAKLGFTRPAIISPEARIDDSVLGATSELLGELSAFLSMIVPGYWGNSCQTLSTNIFAHLNNQGIPANIVLGNVWVGTTDEFETTLESLRQEVLATEQLQGEQKVHAWISLGGDTIVDAALPPRLVTHYKAPEQFNDMMFIGRAAEMVDRYNIKYQPILVGTEFFARTNPPDPMDLLNRLQSLRA
ncbi:hypothetical protein [Paracidovorax avenae]|uniref:hypothetical protein n=1 Tax=Paracidovorax avenae TaxID=80867 RepID=UPI00126019C0|nr:hypothetical protein [Paracidovorax avenae]